VDTGLSKQRTAGLGLVRALAPVAALILLVIVLSLLAPSFLTLDNILSIGPQAGIIGLLAVGETAVIIAGAIDLSVGSVMTFSGIVLGLLMAAGVNPVMATICCILTGAAWGVFNGVVTAYGRIPAFITTLGSLGMAKGLALILAGGQPIFKNMAGYRFLGQGKILGIPVVILVLAAAALIMHIVLTRTSFGRHIYAIGGNKESARLSGVNVERVTVAVFTMSGALAGLAAALMASRLSSAQLTSGDGAELDAIAATVIGGCSLMGGQGYVGGTILGIMLMGVLRNGLSVMSASQWAVSPFWQQVIIGAVIVGAVLFDQWLRRIEARA
jgi:ribose transport system permease protein